MSLVVETEAIDDRVVLHQPEQARARIARLRQRRDRADLDEAEARAQQGVGNLGALVETRGEAEGIWKVEPEGAHAQARIALRRGGKRRMAQREHGGAVRVLRVHAEEQGARDGAEQTHHGSALSKSCAPSDRRGRGLAHSASDTSNGR